ncbi:MFS family permease [Granulicella aggregans]|uniref:MFS family permease n=1 Tax=Granulicella aggregans TaxID=474949 RepID=A0A7W7Z922_9BACT|nr:MFS transporter [Granulicella aggregans]MBB5055569.1 MFS family permease [Granulicella aggregans]
MPTETFLELAKNPTRRNTLIAASLGWMLDSMDVMLFSLLIPAIERDLQISAATAGGIMSLTLISAAIGGVFFGFVADRFGRTRALSASILIYCLATGLCAFTHSAPQLAACRILLGLGMGGEWAAGAALVAETWPTSHRARALGLVQSAWAVGYALAAAITAIVMPRFSPHLGWRAVFLIGMAPALVTLWIRRSVHEPTTQEDPNPAINSVPHSSQQHRDEWVSPQPSPPATSFKHLFHAPLLRSTLIITSMNAASLFAWWGLFSWVPAFLSLPSAQGGHGLNIVRTSTFTILMQAGTFLGYTLFGVLADCFARKRVYITYLVIAAALVPVYTLAGSATAVLLLGPLVGFFGTGFFSGFSVIAAEAFPTALRGRAMGMAYNLGRIASAAAPYTIGKLSQTHGIGPALVLTSAGFLGAAMIASRLQNVPSSTRPSSPIC